MKLDQNKILKYCTFKNCRINVLTSFNCKRESKATELFKIHFQEKDTSPLKLLLRVTHFNLVVLRDRFLISDVSEPLESLFHISAVQNA